MMRECTEEAFVGGEWSFETHLPLNESLICLIMQEILFC